MQELCLFVPGVVQITHRDSTAVFLRSGILWGSGHIRGVAQFGQTYTKVRKRLKVFFLLLSM